MIHYYRILFLYTDIMCLSVSEGHFCHCFPYAVSVHSQQQDLSSFQFPVDDEDENKSRKISRQKSGSAMKKSGSTVSLEF